jgi:hypothetical protein
MAETLATDERVIFANSLSGLFQLGADFTGNPSVLVVEG